MLKKRALITGCCGFIGSELSRYLLDAGYTVHGVDDESTGDIGSLYRALAGHTVRTVPSWCISAWEETNESVETRDFVLFRDDFCSQAVLTRILNSKYDVVIHLAAYPSVEMSVNLPVSTYMNNTQKAIDLFYACSKSKTKVIFASSAAVYGFDGIAAESEINLSPKSPYALQKLHSEQAGQLFSNLYGLNFIALRFFNVYGIHQEGSSAYSTVLASWRDRLASDLPLRIDGDGSQTRDYVYIDDVSRAISTAIESSCSGVFNVATGNAVSNNEILSILRQDYNFETINAPERIGDIKHSVADVEVSKDVLGFSAKIKIKEGIKIMFSGEGKENV